MNWFELEYYLLLTVSRQKIHFSRAATDSHYSRATAFINVTRSDICFQWLFVRFLIVRRFLKFFSRDNINRNWLVYLNFLPKIDWLVIEGVRSTIQSSVNIFLTVNCSQGLKCNKIKQTRFMCQNFEISAFCDFTANNMYCRVNNPSNY